MRNLNGRVEGFHIDATDVMESDHKIPLREARFFSREDIHPFVKIDHG
jgi:hypothetical protein